MHTILLDFFGAWDALEQQHPFGITQIAPLFRLFDVPPDLCAQADAHLFLDLMYSRRPAVRRIKVEHRHSRAVVWFYVDFAAESVTVGLQASPNAPFFRTHPVRAEPGDVVATILAHFRPALPTERCIRHGGKRPRAQ
jgi:hypothetical protein